ncbi:hypothetical protein [Bacillus subtilis]|uniref:hypothetical protein n=1 Tax=Bacillus subtilis TaxID=1423 RepID=UPI00397ED4CA
MSTEYRINYTIERTTDGENYEEIGFGSSGAWSDIRQCSHMIASDIDNGTWETEPGHPDPESVKRDIEEEAGL